jgi:hypothetical protein
MEKLDIQNLDMVVYFILGNPPETPSPYLFKKNFPAKQNQNEKRWGEGGTPRVLPRRGGVR